MTALKHAWRNLWRNGKRTSITLAAVALTTALLIVTCALTDGMLDQMIRTATGMVTGEAQAHAPSYTEDHSIYKSLNDPQALLQAAEAKGIGAAPRVYGYGLVACKMKSAGAFFWGVVPETEKRVFELAQHVREGRFLPDLAAKGIVLGRKLARSLQAKVGSEIVILVQAADGSLGNDLFTVTGILATTGDAIDRSAAILHERDFRELFVLGERVHEIAFNSAGTRRPGELVGLLQPVASGAKLETWREIMPMLSDMANLSRGSMWIFLGIFFLAAGLGVLNTMLMATYERFHEFGIMKAVGATPWRIVRDVLLEALTLVVLATILGAALGYAGSYYLEAVGIDTRALSSDITFFGVAFDPIWRASVSTRAFVSPIVVMWVVCLIASIYPAAIAARLDPVKAIQHV